MRDLKQKTIRGGLARVFAQGANFSIRIVSLMILARLLDPKDFGLVGMVTAFIGVLTLFRDFGLSSAAIQRGTVTEKQMSTLFWINISVGALLTAISIALAPSIATFYHQPRLLWVTIISATGLLFNAVGVQHGALLQREMRFTVLAVISTGSLILGNAVAIAAAAAGFGYWALVAMSVVIPVTSSIGLWCATGWLPGLPHRRCGIRSMVYFGGIITMNTLIVYVSNNLDKVLLGRFWGDATLGIYGRAYQLISIPTENLNSSAGEVAFSALSRLQDEPTRLRSYFLKGYSLILAMTLPITIGCALFADDLIAVLLGPKWSSAVPIFRLLAPTILVSAMVNPLGWLIYSVGRATRGLKMALVIAPVTITAYSIGLRHGMEGVACAYSVAMLLWLFPAIIWAVHGTALSVKDIFAAILSPFICGLLSVILVFGVRLLTAQLSPLLRLVIESTVLLTAFSLLLLFASGQKSFYLSVLGSLIRTPSPQQQTTVVEAEQKIAVE